MIIPRALDLFCGGGGASRGLEMAGFAVVGVDHIAQPEYPGFQIIADAIDVLADADFISSFDLVWASPPCQAFTAYRRRPRHVKRSPDLIDPVRRALKSLGVSYIIENVAGAPLRSPVMLCGSMFGIDVQRHRFFECSFPVLQPECQHERWTPRFPPATNRTNLRKTVEVGVWRIPMEVQQRAMGIDWIKDRQTLSQAIPPAYSEMLGRELLRQTQPSPAALTYTIRRPGHAAWAERVPVHRVAVELTRANDVMPGHVAFPDRPVGLDALANKENQ